MPLKAVAGRTKKVILNLKKTHEILHFDREILFHINEKYN